MKKIITVWFIVFCFNAQTAFSQKVVHYSLKTTIAAIDSLHKRQAVEKLYIQTDKPYYAFGDTMRFKAYLFDEALYTTLHSGLFYVELVDDSSQVVKRQVIILSNGVAWGDIVIKNDWYAGNYTLRAYTNWMRNIGERCFFTKQVEIVPAGNKQWLVNSRVAVDKNKNVSLSFRFSDFTRRNLGFRDMQLSVFQGERTLLKQNTRTGSEGSLDFKFPVPQKRADESLYVLAEEITNDGSGTKTIIPIQLNRPEHTDLQFMPEGGNLVGGITSRIGFKAIGEDGLGVDINGKIYNSKQQQVAAFQSTHKGMGGFELTPQTGESYVAKVAFSNDTVKTYPLPAVHPSGITFRIDDSKDSLEITLSSADLPAMPSTYYLVAQARDKVCYGARVVFKNNIIHIKIPQAIFPTGIVNFVLMDAANKPVTQRMVFVDHDDRLNLNLITGKESYSLRDSINLQLAVKDNTGNPVQGNFSLAVTDDSRVRPFDADAGNIMSHVLLSTDLKGNIENPGYYFNKDNADRKMALNVLVLTQGWTGYDWKPLFDKPVEPKFEAEIDYSIKGRASDIFGLPIRNTEIMLMSTNPVILMKTKTGKGGRFTFSGFPEFADTMAFHLQPNLGFNIGIKMYGFYPPDITPVKYTHTPWYINSDSVIVSYISKKQAEQEEAFDIGKSKLLKEVVITDKKKSPLPPIVVSMNSEDLRNTQKKAKPLSVLQLIHQLQKKLGGQWHIDLTVDGRPPKSPDYSGPFDWLYQYNTNDIKSMTIRQSKYNIWVAVITNSGKGDVLSGTKGNDFRPMPISWPHQFYSPRYTVTTPATVKDNRSTIYWAPNILTDNNGIAIGSFFSANQPGTYTLILEGTDLNGNIGYLQKKITIHQ